MGTWSTCCSSLRGRTTWRSSRPSIAWSAVSGWTTAPRTTEDGPERLRLEIVEIRDLLMDNQDLEAGPPAPRGRRTSRARTSLPPDPAPFGVHAAHPG